MRYNPAKIKINPQKKNKPMVKKSREKLSEREIKDYLEGIAEILEQEEDRPRSLYDYLNDEVDPYLASAESRAATEIVAAEIRNVREAIASLLRALE